jgi:retinol dehydrogenase-14
VVRSHQPGSPPHAESPAQDAQTPIYLASSPDMDGATGQFFAKRKPTTANKVTYDRDMAARLWQVSADLVAMTLASP